MTFELNKRIAIKEGFSGVIRYIGEVEGKDGEWVGIELDSPIGSNDGSYRGRQYFTCPSKCGVFVRTNRLASEGANDDSENYVIKERRYNSSFSGIPNYLDYSGIFSASRTPNERESATDMPSIHTSFSHAVAPVYNGLFCNAGGGVEHDAVALEAENRHLREQLARCKELFYSVLSSCKTGMSKINLELQDIQSRLSRIKRPVASPGEKELVASIVSELCSEYKKGNKERVSILYDRFKNIISKYNISVE